MMAARRGAGVRRLGALLIALGFVVVGPAAAASASGPIGPIASVATVTGASATATPGSLALAVKPCAPAPAPNRPTAGLPGKLAPTPPATSPGDPFTDEDVALSDVYGYSYRWVNYDNGCIPGSAWGPGFITGIGNLALAGAAGTNALVHSTLGFVVDPSWLAPLDRTITEATETVRAGIWAPWITVTLLLVAGGVLVAASRANISHAVSSAGWAILVLVATTYVMSYPISSARAVDGLIQETVTTSARVTSTDGADGGDDASSALTQQMDTINRNSLYTAWLEGTLGSSDSAVAEQYGPDLFRASHMTWWEAETLDRDPAAGQVIVEEKKNLWSDTAAKVETADPLAYQQLTGNQGRWDAAVTVTLMTAITMPFLLVAGIFVVVAYTVTRLFIPLAPALGVFGMLELARGWVIAVVGQLGRFLIMGPLYWIGALVNLALISAVFGSGLPFGLQVVIALAMPLILFRLFRPKHAKAGAKFMRRMGKMAANAAATRGAVAAGVDDALLGDATTAPRSDGPVAHGPRSREETMPARPATASGTAAAGGTGTAVMTRGTFTVRPPAAEPVEARAPGRDVEFVTGGGATSRRAGAAGLQAARVERVATPAEAAGPGGPLRQHPALSVGDATDQARGGATGEPRAAQRSYPAPPADEDLAAPATPRVLRPEERVPGGVAEANVRDVDGEEVFVLWSPAGARTASLVDVDGVGVDR